MNQKLALGITSLPDKTNWGQAMAQLNTTLDSELLKDLITTDGKDKAFTKLMETILNLT